MLRTFICLTAACLSAPGISATLAPSDAERLFVIDIKPILAEKCFACHGGDRGVVLGELNLTSRESMLKGGKSSKQVLIPGDARASLLYEAIQWSNPDLQMPPKENDRLTEDQVWKIRNWIDAGAPWPDWKVEEVHRSKDRAQIRSSRGVIVTTSGGLSDGWTSRRYKEEDLWAFQPLRRVNPPRSYGEHPIDSFVESKFSDANVSPSQQASKRILIRRATYDLTGLPPTPEAIDAFLEDKSPEAWDKVIDRLLGSPHYGEQWGRHWLDVVRYADTSGYSNDWERSNAWRYRDYVIRSFNSDKPYNQFVREQIAGDLLDPDDPEMLVATSYLRMGPWEYTEMMQTAISRQLYLDDITNNVGQTFLSLPLRCAKCHDHKFDPIPTRDYYRFYSIFGSTQLAERPAAFLKSENTSNFDQNHAWLKRLLESAEKDVAIVKAKEEKAARAWCAERGIPYQPRETLKDKPEGQKPPRHVGLSVHDLGYVKVRETDARIWKRRLERYQPLANTVYEGPVKHETSIKLRMPENINPQDSPPESFILQGGSVFSRGKKVTPGVLSAVPVNYEPLIYPVKHKIPTGMKGRRLALAKWLVDPENPLSTRSIVNRIWQYHFGKGIAQNANNFGKAGKKPTHPKLLDWLTSRFVEEGWSIKTLHRLIMTSKTYRRSSHPVDAQAVQERDSNNDLLSYFLPRRLTAEELRDAMLVASGELNTEIGGLPIFPEVNPEFAAQPRQNQTTLAPAYQPSRTPEQRNRRSIYVYRMRMQANPMFEVFNQPDYDLSCERRDSSTVTPQVFTLMNSQNSVDRSIAMALRLQKEYETIEEQVERAFYLTFGRAASGAERKKMAAHAQKMISYHSQHSPEVISPIKELDRTVIEEMSGIALHYKEILDTEDYVSHTKPWDVGPRTRALADLCLALFNSNEFIYVY